ncbi:CBS domain-containing protein [Nocardiopsis composta]|nr:CBS domain-containing protein [Nocardiopsis composta]
MLVREAMTEPRLVLDEDATVVEAAAAFVERGVIAAPVVDGAGMLVGIVTEIDLLRDRFEPDPRATARPVSGPSDPPPLKVSEVMTRRVTTTTENGDAAELAERMVHTRLRCVPVLREGRVVGLVNRSDLLRVHTRPDHAVRDDLLAALAAGAPYLHGWQVSVHDGVARLDGDGAGPEERRLAAAIARTVPGVARVLVDGE